VREGRRFARLPRRNIKRSWCRIPERGVEIRDTSVDHARYAGERKRARRASGQLDAFSVFEKRERTKERTLQVIRCDETANRTE